MVIKYQRTVYEWANISDDLVYEWVHFFKSQVYEWGRFGNTGSHTRTTIIPKLPESSLGAHYENTPIQIYWKFYHKKKKKKKKKKKMKIFR